MKALVVGDIHGNLPALNAVLEDSIPVDKIYCTGDVVGILGFNKEVTEIVQTFDVTVLGNHDKRINPNSGYIPQEFHSSPRSVKTATHELYAARDQLSDEQLEWLFNLPTAYYDEETDMYITHNHPDEDRGVGMRNGEKGVTPRTVTQVDTDSYPGYWLALGHSHTVINQPMDKFPGKTGHIINPGSVGYPIGSATYITIDTTSQTAETHLVEYDVTPLYDRLKDTEVYDLLEDLKV